MAEEREVDALGGEPLKVATYDERHKMPKVLEDEMKHCLTLAKDAEVDARAIMEARNGSGSFFHARGFRSCRHIRAQQPPEEGGGT